MSKRKGLSLEEKRQRMLQIFYEKKDVFQLKDLEKLGPSEKGITMQSVKEVVQSLVDDGYADSEKIGTSTYFWAFPSKAAAVRQTKLEQLEQKLVDFKKKNEEITESIKMEKMGREDTPQRAELLAKLEALQAKKQSLQKELEKYRDCDPDVIEQEKKDIELAKEASERWTDNVLSIRKWMKTRFGINEEDINKQYEIPEDFEDT